MSDWVSTNDRWPEKNGRYLVTYVVGYIQLAGRREIHPRVGIADKHDNHWTMDNGDYDREVEVLCWQNLPEIGKEDGIAHSGKS